MGNNVNHAKSNRIISMAAMISVLVGAAVIGMHFWFAGTQTIKIAFTGDQGSSNETMMSLQMIRQERAEALVVLGDFEYEDNAALWIGNIDKYLGKDFPVLAVAGNHEEKVWDSYAEVIKAKIAQLPRGTCASQTVNDIGLTYDCRLGPVHISFVSPDIHIPQASMRDPALAIRTAFGPANGMDEWRICGWHKVHRLMQLGTKDDAIDWNIYEECRGAGAYIFTGHDHVYARSKTVSDFPGMIVGTSTSEVVVRPGWTGVAIVGIGGKGIRIQERMGDPWWASTLTLENVQAESGGNGTTTAGVMFCTFDKVLDTAPCYFKTVDGVIRDRFVIRR